MRGADAEPLFTSGDFARPPVIVLTTDTEWSARSFESLFSAHGSVVVHWGADRELSSLALGVRPDAILVEHRLPALDAADVLARLRDEPRLGVGVPVLVIGSSPIDRAQRLALYAAGAWDYCTQPLDGEVLLRQLRTFMIVKRHVDQLHEAALRDLQTGLYTARGLAQRARELGAGAHRRHEALACIAFSLQLQPVPGDDRVAGRAAASAARLLARAWALTGRVGDALGHLGPSEFGLIAPAADVAGADALQRRLCASLDGATVEADGVEYTVHAHARQVGVDDYASAPVDASEMLRDAHRALHDALGARTASSLHPAHPGG